MSCPECSNVRREYLLFRKAVDRFAHILDQLEVERRRIADVHRPASILQPSEPEEREEAPSERAKRRSSY